MRVPARARGQRVGDDRRRRTAGFGSGEGISRKCLRPRRPVSSDAAAFVRRPPVRRRSAVELFMPGTWPHRSTPHCRRASRESARRRREPLAVPEPEAIALLADQVLMLTASTAGEVAAEHRRPSQNTTAVVRGSVRRRAPAFPHGMPPIELAVPEHEFQNHHNQGAEQFFILTSRVEQRRDPRPVVRRARHHLAAGRFLGLKLPQEIFCGVIALESVESDSNDEEYASQILHHKRKGPVFKSEGSMTRRNYCSRRWALFLGFDQGCVARNTGRRVSYAGVTLLAASFRRPRRSPGTAAADVARR